VTQILTIKNTGADGTWTGQTILAGATFTIVESKRKVWRKDTQVFTDVANGILVVGDGVNDITDVVKGWNWMLGDTLNQCLIWVVSLPCIPQQPQHLVIANFIWSGLALVMI